MINYFMQMGNPDTQSLKRAVAEAALEAIPPGGILGIGTGSTVNAFIDLLPAVPERFEGFVSSSEASTKRLHEHGLKVVDLGDAGPFGYYVDGADEVDPNRCLIKGGGGALTREKIVAESADQFVCIVDDTKMVECLGAFPLPIEIIPMARNPISEALRTLGGDPQLREGFITDNGQWILDVHGLVIKEPVELERWLDQIPGVVTNGLFARRRADQVLVATETGVVTQ